MPRWCAGNELQWLQTGDEFFPVLLEQLAAAQQRVFVETYILRADAVGNRIHAALIAAARRGVVVHVLIDGFGSADLPAAWLQALRDAGVRWRYFRPDMRWWRVSQSRLRRLHRKLVVVDGKVALIGGINLHDDRDGPAGVPRLDFAALVRGPVVIQCERAAMGLWKRDYWRELLARPHGLLRQSAYGGVRAALLTRDNLRHRHRIEQEYLHRIAGARSHILIANAYFLPGHRFRQALIQAARRGVHVTLLLQGHSEYWLQHQATRALYHVLQQAGIRIVEYQHTLLHAKVAVIDRHWATVGSSNIDPFSLFLAREANLVVWDTLATQQLLDRLQAVVAQHGKVVPLTPAASWGQRLLPALCYQVVRVGLGLLGRAVQDRF
jgi:cardiolipin synthase